MLSYIIIYFVKYSFGNGRGFHRAIKRICESFDKFLLYDQVNNFLCNVILY